MWLSDSTLDRLRALTDWPDLTGTKYELIELMGRGGMGAVYKARDTALNRDVAVKVLESFASASDVSARLLKEARILAALEHPGIVPIHDVGVLGDGRPFYVMKLVRGQRLDEQAKVVDGLGERLRIFTRICEAVAFAHARDVIHRDLKPENVMVGAFGEVLVLDWGVAKVLNAPMIPAPPEAVQTEGPVATAASDNPGATQAGTILGTPGYMAPEQAAGAVSQVDVRSDVYALGGILHFLLADRAPDATPSPEGDAARVASRALAAIRDKARAERPEDRYQSVPELFAEIERFLNGMAVEAYREGYLAATLRFARRHKTPILLVVTYLVVRLILIFLS